MESSPLLWFEAHLENDKLASIHSLHRRLVTFLPEKCSRILKVHQELGTDGVLANRKDSILSDRNTDW